MGAPTLISPTTTSGGGGDITPVAGAIRTLALTNAGSGGSSASYREQALTNITGTGSGATADVYVFGGVVSTFVLRSPGTGYAGGDTLSVTLAGLTGAVFTVSAVVTSNNTTGNVTANRIAAGSTNPTTGIATNAGFVSTTAPLIFSSSFSGGVTQYRTGLLVNMDGEPLFQSAVTASEASTATGAGFMGRWNLSARTTNTSVNGVNAQSSIATPNASGTSTSYGGQFVSIYSGATFTGATTNGVGVFSQVTAAASIGANTFTTFYAYDANLSCTSTSVQTISNAGYLVPRVANFAGAAHAIGNFYGVYLPTTTLNNGATITNRYGVFQQDPAAVNQFAGTMQFNNGFGSVATVYGTRAWVNINGGSAGTFAGGASTVSRAAGSTTATVTTTTAHGLITGNYVDVLTGVVAGLYQVTFVNATTFTITTVATTLLSAVAITFAVNPVRASGNVSSVGDGGSGIYHVNFATAMPDVDYAISGTTIWTGGPFLLAESGATPGTAGARTVSACSIICGTGAGANTDVLFANVVITR